MSISRLLVIESDEANSSGAAGNRILDEQIRRSNCKVSRVAAADAPGYLKDAVVAGQEPSVMLFCPSLAKPLLVARQLRAVSSHGHLIFVAMQERIESLRRELSRTPKVGSDWSIAGADSATLAAQIEEAARGAQKRVRLRTTLDRANLQISAPKAVDSTEYRRLTLSDHYLATVLTQAHDPMVSIDVAGRIVFWSAGAERVFGLASAEAIGRLLSDTPVWSDAMAAHLARVQSQRYTSTVELLFNTGAGCVSMDSTISAVRDERGAFIGSSVMMHDVTARAQQLAAEQAARLNAEQLNRLMDDFMATLSHELRTPLNSILGWSQLLRAGKVPDEKRAVAVATIERNAHHQAKLIEDLLDISSVISGKLHLELKAVRLSGVVGNAVTSLRPDADKKNLQLLESLQVDHDIVMGDPVRLQQIVWNLLSNAIKFTPAQGQVSVRIENAGPFVRVIVADNGQGLEPEFAPHIFDRFRQADSSITRRSGGLGLGLAIVKQLVNMHNGDVRAASPGPGFGTTFTVTLPAWGVGAADATERADEAHPVGLASSLDGLRVLVVDDEADARDLVSILLLNHGARTLTAESADHALEVIDQFNPELLISDIGMPGVDGYDLLKAIRATDSAYQDMPAIALTAFAGHVSRDKAYAAGFQHHLAKPFQASELLALIVNLAGDRLRKV